MGFPPKSSHGLIGFSMIFTIHFGGKPTIFWKHPNFFGKSNGVTESGYRCLVSVSFSSHMENLAHVCFTCFFTDSTMVESSFFNTNLGI